MEISRNDIPHILTLLSRKTLTIVLVVFAPLFGKAQVDENQMGAWYMYFFNGKFGDGPWGVQGDVQLRNWKVTSDLEQLLIRGGLTYKPKETNVLLTVGYANITTGEYGESNATTTENRIYQEAMYPVRMGNRIYLNHRFRFEQRFLEGDEFRTRYRFNLFMNIPLNQSEMSPNALYLAFYNELFIQGYAKVEAGTETPFFDRNRFYTGLGHIINNGLRMQLGIMNQTTNNWSKNQLQISLHHSF